ncbi:MAG: hypothetical protein QWI73_06915, partial [Alphaproteobacteria bacterium]|nr:hypothetical protein [Alphaproteobacteria bacterium]
SLMSRYTLVAAGDGSEMWALERALIRSTDQPQLIRMFRIGLQGVPSLGSMALQYLLLRRPLDSLMVFSAGDDRTRSGGKVRLRRQLRKQERTLPVLRAFVQRMAVLKAFGTQYLPKEE